MTKPFVFVVAPLPPPIHGVAATTEGVLTHLGTRARIRVANISPGRARGLLRHFVKTGRTLKAIAGMAGNVAVPARALYMTADGGAGQIYNIAVAASARCLGYRLFLHHHSFAYIDRYSRLMAALVRVIGRRGTHIVLCPKMAQGLSHRYGVARTLELSTAALLPPAPQRPRRSGPEIRLGFLSNLIVEKGLDTSIDLLRAARNEGLPVVLMLAGAAPDRRARVLLESAKAEFGEALAYLGPLPESSKSDFYNGLDAFTFPSRYANEAQPRAVLEALAHGVPVLTIDRSCITSDMGVGTGLCAPGHQEFIAHALPILRQWSRDRHTLAAASDRAGARAAELYEAGGRQLAGMADALCDGLT